MNVQKSLLVIFACAALVMGGHAAEQPAAKQETSKSICTDLVYVASNTSPAQEKNIQFLLSQENYHPTPRELADAMCAIQYGSKNPQIIDLIMRAGYEFGHPCRFPCAGRASEDLKKSLDEALEKGELVAEPAAAASSDSKNPGSTKPEEPDLSKTNTERV